VAAWALSSFHTGGSIVTHISSKGILLSRGKLLLEEAWTLALNRDDVSLKNVLDMLNEDGKERQ
jgi:hypothetical protein